MSANTYKLVEIVGTSSESLSDAVRSGVSRARKTLRNLDWFQVTEIRGNLQGNDTVYQAVMKIGLRLDDDD